MIMQLMNYTIVITEFHLSQSYTCASFSTNKTSKASLILHNAVRNTHLTTERRKENHQLEQCKD